MKTFYENLVTCLTDAMKILHIKKQHLDRSICAHAQLLNRSKTMGIESGWVGMKLLSKLRTFSASNLMKTADVMKAKLEISKQIK